MWLHRAPFCWCSKLCTDLFCFPFCWCRADCDGTRKGCCRTRSMCLRCAFVQKPLECAAHFSVHNTEFPPLYAAPGKKRCFHHPYTLYSCLFLAPTTGGGSHCSWHYMRLRRTREFSKALIYNFPFFCFSPEIRAFMKKNAVLHIEFRIPFSLKSIRRLQT